ncbi:serine hydrolase domain-containing protein [Mycolicibacterium sp. jd]|uniref:serine hydrolase domain-containing protein n=1 Tax=unclassified Mycolicibacterium TaxID=2636767 RepID=UPI00351AEA0F
MAVPRGLVHGDVDEGYGPVADAFRQNFAERDEIGAACAVYRDGRKVVDLWGGFRDGGTRQPWCEDTVVTMFSTTKGLAALTLALAHSRGWLDYEQPVAAYWPQFAWRGKSDITVRQLLAHQAGLAAIDLPLSIGDLADLDLLAAVLALQTPLWKPGSRHGYHGITFGWYAGELLRCVDPEGRSLGRFFAEVIAQPLGAEFFIGLPDGFDLNRRANLQGYRQWEAPLHLGEVPRGVMKALLTPGSLFRRAFANPPELSHAANFNRPELLRIELPAGNGTGEVRAVAGIYGAVVSGGAGLTAATLELLTAPARPPSDGILDLVVGVPIMYSLGFVKPTREYPFGSCANAAFAAAGNGGSFGLADPDTGVGYCYAPNRLGMGLTDEREVALRDALYRDVLGERPQRAQ